MAQNIYIAGVEQGSGKSAIVLTLMELLSGETSKLGFFRPLIHQNVKQDKLIRLVIDRYHLKLSPESMYGCSADVARELLASNRYDELLKIILRKYKSLESQCDRILCAGPNFNKEQLSMETDFNADVANNLGCLLIPILRGDSRNVNAIIDATVSYRQSLKDHDCDILAVFINGVDERIIKELTDYFKQQDIEYPVYLVPTVAALEKPTISDIVNELNAKVLRGDNECLKRDVLNYKVAAMQVPHFLDHLEEGDLVITPGDRSDIILASLMAHKSTNYPQISGLLLSGKQEPDPQITQLISGISKLPFTVLGVASDTFTTAINVTGVQATLDPANERKIAAALGAVEKSIDIPALKVKMASTYSTRVTPIMFEYELIQRAKAELQHIVLPEGQDERILRAAEILILRGVAKLTLLGDEEAIRQKIQLLGLHLNEINIISPLKSPLRKQYAECYFKLRQHKGINYEMAFDTLSDSSYFGTMMVHLNDADGMVSGAIHTTQHTIRPAFQIIKTKPGTSIVSSVFFMCLEDRVLIYGDCAINPEPNAQQLADIAVSSAETALLFHIAPRIAMLSYSTGESGQGQAVNKVREAVRLSREQRPDLKLEGPIQYDAAIDVGVAKTKLPDSDVAGQANVFIFPDLNTGNNTYKAVQRTSGAVAIGPVLQGLNKPVNDLSRGCTVTDIVNTVAITAVQAQINGVDE
ncbi:MAG: phosphate acetyltransferase [Methylococcaceae bacterium]|nr:phosphate acetyltransferase [Methylococcaceae bacterium]